MKRKLFFIAVLLTALVCAGCGGDSGSPENLLLSLSFNEDSGNQVSDSAGDAGTAEVAYNFTNAAYTESRGPEWRAEGVQG